MIGSWLKTHVATVLYVAAMAAVVVCNSAYARHLANGVDARLSYRNCVAIENLKAGQREAAEATIEGNQKLLDAHDLHGAPLPVPRAAIAADIVAKQKVVDRFPPRDCGDPP